MKPPDELSYLMPLLSKGAVVRYARRYYRHEALDRLREALALVGYTLRPAADLPRWYKERWSGYRIRVGRKCFYLLPLDGREVARVREELTANA